MDSRVRYRANVLLAALGVLGSLATPCDAQLFHLPTANRALFEKGGEEKFFVPTTGKTWVSGTFGCVRTEGNQMHEGIDIRCLQRDRRGEPVDPVLATADGTVAYANTRSALSNFGKYLVLRHDLEGLEIYSLYAHLGEIRVQAGARVQAGQTIAIMGRTANTREGISKERAHLHFELDLLLNDRFAAWFKKNRPGERNDHGAWNGQNLIGIDPRRVFVEQRAEGGALSLRGFLLRQTEMCRVLVYDAQFPWVRRCPGLIVADPKSGSGPVAGYELVLDYNGVPFQAIPRPASAFGKSARPRLVSVNRAEQERHHCRKLVTSHAGSWALTARGQDLLDLLTY